LQLLPAKVPVVCTTATANDRVVQDVVAQIPNLQVQRGSLTRPSLKLYNIKLSDQSERLAWLAQFVPKLPGSGIIYCLTIPDTRRVAAWLWQKGILAREYHSKLENEERLEAERALIANECKALVATVALGMGFDKPISVSSFIFSDRDQSLLTINKLGVRAVPSMKPMAFSSAAGKTTTSRIISFVRHFRPLR
jgi:ATP-dependent DNA helicase RecQ